MRFRLLVFAVLFVTSAAFAASVTGAKVKQLAFANGDVTAIVENVSVRDITGFSLNVICKSADGTTHLQGRTEDYGPTALTNKAFRPGETIKEEAHCPAMTKSATAEVTVAIYDDQTAEVTDDHSFRDTMAVRQGVARAMQLAAQAVRQASTNAQPHLQARQNLETLVSDQKNGANKKLLQQEIDVVKTAPAGREQEFIEQEAERLERQASLFAQSADVRRLP